METVSETEQFIELLLVHRRRIYAFIAVLVPNPADVEDLLQETSVRMWQNFGKFKAGTDFAAWAFPFARYAALNFHRAARRARKRVTFSSEVVEIMAERLAASSWRLGDRGEVLASCVETLPERSRSLLALCYAPGATVRGAAEQVGRSERSLSKTLSRIREALVECVERKLTGARNS